MSNVCFDDDRGRGEGVTKSNSMSRSEVQDKTRMSDLALCGEDYQVWRAVGNKTRISWAVIKKAGCKKSERMKISSEKEELN